MEHSTKKTKLVRLAIVSAPICEGQRKEGVDKGPQTLVDAGLVKRLENLEFNVTLDSTLENELNELAASTQTDRNLNTSGSPCDKIRDPNATAILHHGEYVAQFCKKLAVATADHASKNDFVLTVGGDHSLATGSIAGIAKMHKNLCVVWVDAHADINTAITTESGNMHGCPVAFLLGLIEGAPTSLSWIKDFFNGGYPLKPDKIVYIGLRDIDAGEKCTLRRLGIRAFTASDIEEFGINSVIQMALDHVNPYRAYPIHLSFDIDSIDPQLAPSTGTPVPGGLTFREGRFICEKLFDTGKLVSMDMVEVNPNLGSESDAQKTVDAAISLIESAFGKKLL